MARMRRSSEQTLEYKIEQAEAKVAKTREAHEKAVDELKKLYDIRAVIHQRNFSVEINPILEIRASGCIQKSQKGLRYLLNLWQ